MEGHLALVHRHLPVHLLRRMEVLLRQSWKWLHFTGRDGLDWLLFLHVGVWTIFIGLIVYLAVKVVFVGLQGFHVRIMNKVRLDQVMQLCSVKLSRTNVEKSLKTLALAVSLNVKHKLIGSEVGFDMVRHALNCDSRVKAIFGHLNVFESNPNEGSVFGEEDLFFVKHVSASNDVFLGVSGSEVFEFIIVLGLDIISHLAVGLEAE